MEKVAEVADIVKWKCMCEPLRCSHCGYEASPTHTAYERMVNCPDCGNPFKKSLNNIKQSL
jgi:hypothetical protein